MNRIRFRKSTARFLFCSIGLLPSSCKHAADPVPETSLSGSTIVGRVTDNATSLPVAFARVSLAGSSRIGYSMTDLSGRFVFTGVSPGTYRVQALRAEFVAGEVPVPDGIRDTSTVTIALDRKAGIPTAKPLSQGIYRINGKVLEEDYNGDGIYQPYKVKGVAFAPTMIGGYSYNQEAIDRSMLYLDTLHANTIRTYSGADPYLLLRATEHGIAVIVSFWVDASYNPADPSDRDQIITNFSSMVRALKDYPCVLLWNIGNEQNLPSMNGDNPYWYDLVQELAVTAFEIESRYYHPVCASNGDFLNIGDRSKRADDSSLTYMDLWGSNIYHMNLANSFGLYRTRTNKPVVITEFGIDALNNQTKLEYEDVQARQDSLNWVQIVGAADMCVGASVFEFTDEWWKAGDPAHHDFGGYATGEHPDGYSNEEWWGLIAVTQDSNGDGYDEWRPRKVFRMFEHVWQ